MEQTANDTVIRKIQALFALASSSNEHEASLAMAKAQEMLAKYNLDMAILNEPSKKTVGEAREKRTINKSAMYRWQQQLWSTLADCNFCWHFITHEREAYRKRGSEWDSYRKVKRHRIIGRQSNVIAVQMMGEYLCETIERILPYANKDRLSNAALSWRQGCSDRLILRINEQFNEARKQDVKQESTSASNSTALALRSVTDAEYAGNYDFLYGEGAYAKSKLRDEEYRQKAEERSKAEALALANETPAQKKVREAQEAKNAKDWERASARWRKEEQKRRDNTDWTAYAEGTEAGKKIGLNDQLSTTKTKELL